MTATRRHLMAAVWGPAVCGALLFPPGARGAPSHVIADGTGRAPRVAVTAGDMAAAASGAPRTSAGVVVLSNERTFTTCAHAVQEVPIRARPDVHAPGVGRTHLLTEDGFPEVYLLLSSVVDSQGGEWVRLRIPGRPNGRTGWVPREALGDFHVSRWLVEISLGRRRLRAYDRGRLRFSAPVGVGKPSTPTPTGRFWIRERIRPPRSSPYWPYALGTSAYSSLTEWPAGGVVGIHGAFGAPQLIPGAPSHGCIRMHDGDIAWLAPRVPLGTPVHIIR